MNPGPGIPIVEISVGQVKTFCFEAISHKYTWNPTLSVPTVYLQSDQLINTRKEFWMGLPNSFRFQTKLNVNNSKPKFCLWAIELWVPKEEQTYEG